MPVQGLNTWWTRFSRPGVLMVAVVVLGLGLIACGGSDDEDSTGSEATSTATTGGTSGGGSAATASSTPATGGTSGGGSATTATATATTAAGGSGSSDGAAVGTEQGNQIANAAMLVVEDFPGSGWSVGATDDFEGSLLNAQGGEFANTPACGAYASKMTAAAAKAQEARVGRAGRSFQQVNSLFGMTVDAEVAVYRDSRTPATLISEARGAFGSTDFENCFREVLKGEEAGGAEEFTFDLKASRPLASVPHSGIAQAYDLSLSSEGVTFSFHAELYAWANKNATAFVTVFGSPDEVTADIVNAAVAKTEDKLSRAQ